MRANEIQKVKKVRRGRLVFKLDDASRTNLARQFPPKFSEFIGSHITYNFKACETDPMPDAKSFAVVGYACDPAGIEALIVEVDGSTHRPDGDTYHCTWSLDRAAGFKPVNSNNLIAEHGYERLPSAINIVAIPKFF